MSHACLLPRDRRPRRSPTVFALVALAVLATPSAAHFGRPAEGTQGMVASPHRVATDAGLSMLESDTDNGETKARPISVHTIAKPKQANLPFLISNHNQDDLVKRLRLGGWISIGVFLLAGAAAVGMVSERLV